MFGGGKFDPWEAPAVSTWRQDIVSLPQTLMTSFMALAAAHIQIQTKSVSLVSFIIFPSIHTIIFITTLWNCNILIYEIQHFVWPIWQFSFGLSVKQIQMNFEVILFALILVARQIACFNRARYHEKMYLHKVENSRLVNGKISIIKYCRYDGIHPGGKRSYTQVDYNVPYKSLAGTNFKVDSHKMFFLHSI